MTSRQSASAIRGRARVIFEIFISHVALFSACDGKTLLMLKKNIDGEPVSMLRGDLLNR
jgi:hypothetical protein